MPEQKPRSGGRQGQGAPGNKGEHADKAADGGAQGSNLKSGKLKGGHAGSGDENTGRA
jgi:hypothetical protein